MKSKGSSEDESISLFPGEQARVVIADFLSLEEQGHESREF
ncbi:hypothetical protein OVA24_20755 [Luteolibacter sp. SL250]|nr:hypothetical protein [Luteolibacter sp. SL250]WAC19654.1 hypothetical protein OVA24_20755 [Luteolibacter sp. SL250]